MYSFKTLSMFATLAIMTSGPWSTNAEAQTDCLKVGGAASMQFTVTRPGTLGTGVGTATGDLAGPISFINIGTAGNGKLVSLYTYSTPRGDLYTIDYLEGNAIKDGINHFNSVSIVLGGTGVFAFAAGKLHTDGTFDPLTGAVSLDYNGWICFD